MTLVTIDRHQDIDTGHRVPGHEGQCKHLHGHTYRIHFTCTGEQDQLGRVIDFGVIKTTLCQWLLDNWDHRFLLWEKDPWLIALQSIDSHVTILPTIPTAENMALHLLNVVGPQQLAGTGVSLIMVRVEETRKCAATVATGLWTATEQED